MCLIRGGATDIEQRDANLWRGFLDEGGALLVERFASPREAQEAGRVADLIETRPAGRYLVKGGMKGEGTAEAVATVADCLLNG